MMIKRLLAALLFLSAFLSFTTLNAQDYYVSALTGSNNNDGLTPETALATIARGTEKVSAGGTVYIMNGTYSRTTFGSVLDLKKSGTADAYITFKPYPGHSPLITASEGSWEAMVIDGSYIIIDGLELRGNNANTTYTDAYQAYLDYINKVKGPQARYNTNCISIGKTQQAHHVTIRNCKIHDFPGAGVGGGKIDYLTIENNQVYNNSWYTMYATSGISILDPTSIDNQTGYKILIRNNVVHNNKTLVPWERIKALSDGNGIILDVNTGTSTTPPYVGRILVENNVSYNNGGGGIHGFRAAHADIINNTAYNNGTVVGYPEIDANQCSDFRIYNNIMYARTGGNTNGNDAGAIYDYNQYFNGPSFRNGANDRTGDPLFVLRATDATANFRLQAGSPTINNGSNTAGQFSAVDILGVARPVGFASDKGAYEYPTVIARTEMKISQGSIEIVDNTGTYDFGDVSSTAPKTVTFTIENIGDLGLNLMGTPRVVVANTTGTGFLLAVDAPVTISAKGSATFQVTLSPSAAAGNYAGTISIANSDADENPYNFAITGYGYDGNKAMQTITFPALQPKVVGTAEFDPGATSSAGLTITYTSSNTNVATIVNGKIRVTTNSNNAGTTIITASQLGDGSTNPARSVMQELIVTPNLPPAGTNMVNNPTFDLNANGWSFAYRPPANPPANTNVTASGATIVSTPMTGSSTNVGKVTPGNLGSPLAMDNVQVGTRVFLIKGRNYLISFKGNADAPRNINLRMLMVSSPFSTLHTVSNIALTTTQSTFGTYAYTSSFTGYVDLRFWVGNTSAMGSTPIPVYLDDVTMIEEPDLVLSPEMTLKQNGVEIADNTGTFSFGDVTLGSSKTVAFTIENNGNNNLNFTSNPRVAVNGAGFSLVQDAAGNLGVGASNTFLVKFQPEVASAVGGTISIANDDLNENPYNFTITATGIKKEQTVTFADPAKMTYGDAYPTLVATATSNLPVTYTVVGGPGTITTGNVLSYTSAGDIVVEAAQAGDATHNAASIVQKIFTIDKKELVVTADDKTVNFGDPAPAYTHAITGFAFDETAENLTGNPALSSTYTSTTPHTESPVISCLVGSLSSANYSFKTVNGKIKINPTPEINVRQAATEIASNGSYDFGEVTFGGSKTITFTIENTGFNILNLTGSPRISITGEGFSLVTDAPATIDALGNATFEIQLNPNAVGDFAGTVSIANDDKDESSYTFSLTSKAVKADQSITFNALSGITYGDGDLTLKATSTSRLPVTYRVVEGPGLITTGGTLSYTAAGSITIEATQPGNDYFNGAQAVQQTLVVNKKELIVKADIKTVTYGEQTPVYTYTITGFVFDQTAASLTGSPALSSSYTPATPATESPVITCSAATLSAANYSFTTVNGEVKINHTFPQLLEAELANVNGGSIVNTSPGYTGTGYVDHVNKALDYIEWKADVSGAGMCTLKFRYALNNSSQDLVLTVNGATVSVNVRFINTGGWRNWSVVSVPVYLHAGMNTIKLNGGGIAGPNLDHLQIESNIYQRSPAFVTNAIASLRSAFETKINDFVSNELKVYPIPAITDLKVNLSAKRNERIVVSIVDMQGRVVFSKVFVANDGNNTLPLHVGMLGNGTYLLTLNSSGVVRSRMIVIGR